uniref:Sugar phosphate transporter domain-containing protein n=1 Tax=Romanomermis culicivorax TaxID=13658 RepID=A0A915K9D2_ROMCU
MYISNVIFRYTMAKSTSIIFILLFSVLFSLERLRLSIVAVVALVSTGLFLFTYKSTQFHLFGFILVECAAFSSGIRWALSQFMMQRKEIGLDHPIDLMFYLQPWLIGSTLPFALLVEGISLTEMDIDSLETMLQLIVVGGLLSFLLEITEYLLLYYTSGITLSVCNIAKEIVTLIAAHFFKHDVLTNTNFSGLLLLLSGIALHVIIKSKTNQDEETLTKNRVIKFSKLDFKSLNDEVGSKNVKSDLEVLLHRRDDDEEEF